MIFEDKVMIKKWLDRVKIKNYTINDDFTVDVDSDVVFTYMHLPEIRVQFGVINGNFNCSDNDLTSLKGAPLEIHGDFHCERN